MLQDDVLNDSRIATTVVCALMTHLHRGTVPSNVLLDAGEGDLPRQSVVVVSQIASVERARIGALRRRAEDLSHSRHTARRLRFLDFRSP